MRFETEIANATIITPECRHRGTLSIADGRIAAILTLAACSILLIPLAFLSFFCFFLTLSHGGDAVETRCS